jgi:hypothetical protein
VGDRGPRPRRPGDRLAGGRLRLICGCNVPDLTTPAADRSSRRTPQRRHCSCVPCSAAPAASSWRLRLSP